MDIEHLQSLCDAADGHLELAVQTAPWRELERASARRDHVLLRQSRIIDGNCPVTGLPSLEPQWPRLGRDVIHPAQRCCNLRIDRRGRARTRLVRRWRVVNWCWMVSVRVLVA